MADEGKIHWTGSTFVDAGLAAIAAVTGKDLADLTSEDLNHAARELQRILLSDQAILRNSQEVWDE